MIDTLTAIIVGGISGFIGGYVVTLIRLWRQK